MKIYDVYLDASESEFVKTCNIIAKNFPTAQKGEVLIDVDGSAVRTYVIGKEEIIVYNDYELGMVYVKSNLDLIELLDPINVVENDMVIHLK